MEKKEQPTLNFIEQIIEEDVTSGKHPSIHTRFPPEPNGYLHIGHAKAITVNFGIANKFGGTCNLRFDDTNPVKEDTAYVDSIKKDIEWLGYTWQGEARYASDYFETLYDFAVQLIKSGDAYVDDLNSDEIAALKGTPTEPGKESPYRNRSVDDNLRLFAEMREGKYDEGTKSLRAKIDMASPNMHMRDPIMYRIRKVAHHRTGDAWSIYPMYDFAHGQSDSIEEITHSLCTLEFEVHRPLYNWFIEKLGIYPSRQIEYARLNLTHTVLSKRKLLQLVEEGHVSGWDDPRMPTLSGLRRRGFSPEAIRSFAERVGVAKRDGITDVALLEFSAREDLNKKAVRRMGIMNPLKMTITNYPEGQVEQLPGENNPEDPNAGIRELPFDKHLFIDQDDFMEEPPRKFFRLGPDREVRLKHAYIVHCHDYVKDENGNVTEVLCTYDPLTKSGHDQTGKKVKGTLSWVSATHGINTEVRTYDRLFTRENMNDIGEGEDFKDYINPDSLIINTNAVVEPALKGSSAGVYIQLLRLGYYTPDVESTDDRLILNQTVTLRDHRK